MTSVLRDKNKQVLNQLDIIDNANYGDQENKELSATEIVLMKQKREKNRVMSFSSLFMIIQYKFMVLFIILATIFIIHRLLGYKTCCGFGDKPRDFKEILNQFEQGVEIDIFQELSTLQNQVDRDQRLK